jgi:cephalosporin hydroxylase
MNSHDPKDPVLIARMAADAELARLRTEVFNRSCEYRYTYNFSWLGRPIIQYPQDIVAMQELIRQVQPNLVIETGIAHGGSLILHASILELIGGPGLVLGIDIDIRSHNRLAIEQHKLCGRIKMIEGSSVADEVVAQAYALAKDRPRVLVCLDSNHTHAHVLRELELYSPLVKAGSYLVVFDTIVEDMPESAFADRPWGRGNNPKTAVREFLRTNDRFVVDQELEQKLLLTVAPEGYLRCIKD